MSSNPEHISTILIRMFEPRICLGCNQPFAFQFQMQEFCEPCRAKSWRITRTANCSKKVKKQA